ITTNGVLLAAAAPALRAAGLHRVTVSLDTLRPERFVALTRRDTHAQVLEGIASVPGAGFTGTKLDTVVIRGINDDELADLIEYGKRVPAEVRFIEYMDVGGATRWSFDQVVSRKEMLERLERRYGRIEPVVEDSTAPADRFRLSDGTVFGIISSTTPRPPEVKADVRARGAGGQYAERRLFMQLQVFTGSTDPKPLVTALETSRLEAVLYDDVNDPRGVGVLAMSEDPVGLVGAYRDLLNAEPFAGLSLRSELTVLGRTYASGFEQDLEEWLFRRPRRTVLNAAWPWAIWYPLRRTGAFGRLSPKEQGEIIREHSILGRAYGDADLAHDV